MGVKTMTTKQLAAACRKWRLECTDYTQAHFAKIAGVTVQSICEFEHGRTASMRVYCAYLSCGFKPPAWGIAAEAFPEHMNGGAKHGKK